MGIHIVPTTETYRVHDGAKVTLRITIGEAQIGAWVVAWSSNNVVARGAEPELVDLGFGRDLRGRTLQVVVTAQRGGAGTDRFSRTLAFDGGAEGSREVLDHWEQGDSDDDTVVFTTMIGFQ
jgi:hypothetical protein